MSSSDQENAVVVEEELSLASLAPVPGSRHRRKRVGFGEGSGNGKTCGKGQKGQKARAGGSVRPGFEGGQMPMHRRLPKFGFTSRKRVRGENVYTVVSLERLEALNDGSELTIERLIEAGVLRSPRKKLKVLGGASLTKALRVEAHAVSASAREAIEKAGGQIKIVSREAGSES